MKCIYFKNINHKYPTLLFHCQPISQSDALFVFRWAWPLQVQVQLIQVSQQVCFCSVLWHWIAHYYIENKRFI